MIPVFKPAYGEEELEALREPFRTGWIGLGPKTKEFENRFAEFVGASHVVGVNSATAALHLALDVLDVAGGEVITTPMTFVSTNHAILYNDAKPVFADIEPDTLNIDPADIARLVTPQTKAILVVHYGGHPCDMDAIFEIAKPRGIKVVEDAAHACGSQYKGQHIGSLASDAVCFSFHAVKNLAMGEGGAIAVHDDDLDARLRRLRWLGISKGTWDRMDPNSRYSWYYTVEEVGFKAHLDDIHAALGIAQLGKLERTNARRREIVEQYNAGFADLDWVERPFEKPYAKSALHNYVIKVDRRDDLMTFLQERDIATSVHYYPNHLYRVYRDYYRRLPVAESIWIRLVTLPLFPDLTDRQVNYIIETVRSFGKR